MSFTISQQKLTPTINTYYGNTKTYKPQWLNSQGKENITSTINKSCSKSHKMGMFPSIPSSFTEELYLERWVRVGIQKKKKKSRHSKWGEDIGEHRISQALRTVHGVRGAFAPSLVPDVSLHVKEYLLEYHSWIPSFPSFTHSSAGEKVWLNMITEGPRTWCA